MPTMVSASKSADLPLWTNVSHRADSHLELCVRPVAMLQPNLLAMSVAVTPAWMIRRFARHLAAVALLLIAHRNARTLARKKRTLAALSAHRCLLLHVLHVAPML